MQLRRMTKQGSWIPEVDGLRFIAIGATLSVHILAETMLRGGLTLSKANQDILWYLESCGGRGVLLFFCISGFILGQPFLRQHMLKGQPVSVASFYKRRLTRLEPPYVLSLILYAIAFMVYRGHPQSLLLPLLSHICYVHNFVPSLPPLNLVTWSLEVEIQFYLLAPLLGYLFAVRSTWLRRALMVALIAASAAVKQTTPGMIAMDLPGQLQFFLIGFLLADLRATRTESQICRWWDIGGLAVWITLFTIPERLAFCFGPLILLACMSAFNGPLLRGFFATNWVAVTGGMCYSFYLMHMLVIQFAFKLTRHLLVPSNLPLSYLIQLVLLGSCIVPVCVGYFILIERPCMDPRWPHKLAATLRRCLPANRSAVADSLR
jgi:peptidoglycan/LPS O-acetylase OafA/YrhL